MSRVQPARRAPGWAWLMSLALQVTALSSHALEARVRAALDLEGDAWIGQQVVLQIDLMSNGLSFSDQRIHLPDVPGALVLEDAVSTVKLSEPIEGETWQVLGYRFPLFAQRAGHIEIAPMAVAFKVSEGYGTEAVAFDLKTQALAFKVLSPPGVDDPSELVTTTDFTLQVAVTPQAVDLRVGDALTRTVTRTALDVSGMAFAPLPAPDILGMACYPKTPQVNDSSHRGVLEGTRVEAMTCVLQQAGELTLPEIQLQWWDPVAERLHTETVAALMLEVAANPQQAVPIAALASALDLTSRHPWRAGSALLGMAAALWALFRWAPAGVHRQQRWRLLRQRSEPARFRRLLRAGRSNAPLRTYNAYVQWASGEASPSSAELGDPPLTRELERLQSALIRDESGWRADAFLVEVQRARRQARRKHRRIATQALPKLNP